MAIGMNAKTNLTVPLKQRFFLWLSYNVAGRFIRLLKKTVRLTIIGDENLQTLINDGGKAIFIVWHGNIIIPIMRHIDEGVVILVSEHADGEIVANILSSLGFDLVRGSTTRGGPRALKDMMKRFKSPGIIGMTPDGPKGPYRELKIGAVILSQRTGVPIIPISAYTSRPKFLNSWDKFHFIRPFVHCVLIYGKPVSIERGLTDSQLEEKRLELEKAVHEVDNLAENFFKGPG